MTSQNPDLKMLKKMYTYQLNQKDEEIRKLRKHIEILSSRKSMDYDDCFMICSYEFDEETIDIIGKHLSEFAEMVYDHHYLLISRKEINRNLGIYLMAFDDDCQLNSTLEAIDQLVDIKRKESEKESNPSWPTKRIVPEIKLIKEKMGVLEDNLETIKRESTSQMDRMQSTLDQIMIEMSFISKERENNEKMEKQRQAEKHSTSQMEKIQSTLDEMVVRMELITTKTKINENPEKSKLTEIQQFYNQKNLEFIRNSPVIMDKMCKRLSEKYAVDDDRAEPPFKDILSVDIKKKELIGYFDLLQKNLDGSTKESEIQMKIREWMRFNWTQLVYKPTESEKEELYKEMEKKLNVKNTIGTVCYTRMNKDSYFFFAIANSKIVAWHCGLFKESTLQLLHQILTDHLKWDKNMKFATELDVPEALSDYFVKVSADKIQKISDDEKVIRWMTNNFESLKYYYKEVHHHSIPAIYYLALKYLEQSME